MDLNTRVSIGQSGRGRIAVCAASACIHTTYMSQRCISPKNASPAHQGYLQPLPHGRRMRDSTGEVHCTQYTKTRGWSGTCQRPRPAGYRLRARSWHPSRNGPGSVSAFRGQPATHVLHPPQCNFTAPITQSDYAFKRLEKSETTTPLHQFVSGWGLCSRACVSGGVNINAISVALAS